MGIDQILDGTLVHHVANNLKRIFQVNHQPMYPGAMTHSHNLTNSNQLWGGQMANGTRQWIGTDLVEAACVFLTPKDYARTLMPTDPRVYNEKLGWNDGPMPGIGKYRDPGELAAHNAARSRCTVSTFVDTTYIA